MSKIKTVEAKIKKVHWFVDRRGFLQPIFLLTKKLPSGYDSLALPLTDVTRLGVGIGSVLRMVPEEGNAYDVQSAYRNRVLDVPNTCPSCSGLLHNGKCDSWSCPAHGLTPVRKLFRYFTDLPAFADIYCESFPTKFDVTPVKLDDFSDFLYYLKNIGGVGTTARHDIIHQHLGDKLKTYGRTAQDLVNWELKFIELLSITVYGKLNISHEIFWDLFYIPNLSIEDRNVLNGIDPLTLDFLRPPLSKQGNKQLLSVSETLFRFLDLLKK